MTRVFRDLEHMEWIMSLLVLTMVVHYSKGTAVKKIRFDCLLKKVSFLCDITGTS